jgi:hypothetical protein
MKKLEEIIESLRVHDEPDAIDPLAGITVVQKENKIVQSPTERQTETFKDLSSGQSMFESLNVAIQNVNSLTSENYDISISVFGITANNVKFVFPYTLIFEGADDCGSRTVVVAHYTQVVATTILKPKMRERNVIPGFALGQ